MAQRRSPMYVLHPLQTLGQFRIKITVRPDTNNASFYEHIMEPHGMSAADRALAQILTSGARVDPMAVKHRVARVSDSHEAEAEAAHDEAETMRPSSKASNDSISADSISPSIQAQKFRNLDTAATSRHLSDDASGRTENLRWEDECWAERSSRTAERHEENNSSMSLYQKFLKRKKSCQ